MRKDVIFISVHSFQHDGGMMMRMQDGNEWITKNMALWVKSRLLDILLDTAVRHGSLGEGC